MEPTHFNLPGGHRLGFEPIEVEGADDEQALHMRLNWRPAIDTGDGTSHTIHPGMLTAFLDTLCGITTRFSFGDQPMITATLELGVELLDMPERTDSVVGKAQCVHASPSAAHLAGEVMAGDIVVARGSGVFSLGPQRPGNTMDLAGMFADMPSSFAGFENEPNGFRDFLGYRFDGARGHLSGGDHLIGNPIIRAYHGGLSASLLACTAEDLVAASDRGEGFAFLSQHTHYLLPTSADAPMHADGRIIKLGKRYATVAVSAWQDDAEVQTSIVTLKRADSGWLRQSETTLPLVGCHRSVRLPRSAVKHREC